jgi:hypothetical protein
MSKKKRYPDKLPFKFMGFNWEVKFIDIETENFGITDTDAKTVHIYYKNKNDEAVIETLLHELEHVILFDMAESIFHYDSEKVHDKEENLIRLVSPRTFHFIRDNVPLIEFILKRIKELNNVRRK